MYQNSNSFGGGRRGEDLNIREILNGRGINCLTPSGKFENTPDLPLSILGIERKDGGTRTLRVANWQLGHC